MQSHGSGDGDNGRMSAAEAGLVGRETDAQPVGIMVPRSPGRGAAWKTQRLLCMCLSCKVVLVVIK